MLLAVKRKYLPLERSNVLLCTPLMMTSDESVVISHLQTFTTILSHERKALEREML